MRNIRLFLWLFYCGTGFLQAQQLPLYHFYRDHWGMVNPAGVSSNLITQGMNLSINATLRQQWIKIPEAPKTQILSFEYVNDEYYHLAFGGHLMNDQTGAFGQTGAYGNLAYRLEIGGHNSGNVLAGGFNLGAVQYHVDFAEILQGSDALTTLSLQDLEQLSNSNQLFFDAGVGMMLYLGGLNDRQNYYFGISSPQTFNLNTTYLNRAGEFNIERKRHFYTNAGAYFFTSSSRQDSRDLSFFAVNLWGAFVPESPLMLDADVRYQYKDHFWFGLGGGLSKMAHVEAGVQIGHNTPNILRIGIAYNQFINNLSKQFGQTFEASVSYAWQGN